MPSFVSCAAVGVGGVMALMLVGCSLGDPPPKPVSNWTVEDAAHFKEFPVYWLGETYEELPLTATRITRDGDGVRHTTFYYGDFSLAGGAPSQSWQPSLEVDVQPYCGFAPDEFLSFGEYYESEPISVQVRGVSGYLRRHSSDKASLVLWTGGSAIFLSTWKTELDMEQAALDLVPIAGSSATTLDPLPAPLAASC